MSIMGTKTRVRTVVTITVATTVTARVKSLLQNKRRVRGHIFLKSQRTQRSYAHTHTLTESIYTHTEHMHTHTLSGGNIVQVTAINLALPTLTLNMNSNKALTHLY